ncbi:MAG: hypothetical protein KTR31_36830 [Myxococcales bacterium]|nr:hypothetical protein [Myxococcales bacterium]
MALFELLSRYAHRRVAAVSRHCGGALASSEQEEVVADVLLQLLQGSLASFRGETVPELIGFVRTVADRTTWRIIRRRDRERALLQSEAAELVEDWSARLPAPDVTGERVAESPLSQADQAYLVSLLEAGSKAELARRAGVSRAAVTQRVQRIRNRVAELASDARIRHEVWLTQAAHRVVTKQSVSAETP